LSCRENNGNSHREHARERGMGKKKNVEVMFNGKCIISLLNRQNLL
jgi:hypothetical protein